MKVVDLSLGINHQVWAVAHMLDGYELETRKFLVTTSAWYNGRERGMVFSLNRFCGDRILHIAVFEHRNSDSICALRWENAPNINPPTIDSDGDLAYPSDNKYEVAFSAGPGECGKMAEWVFEQMKAFAGVES